MKTFHVIRATVPVMVAALSSFSFGQLFDFESVATTPAFAGGYTTLSMVSGGQTLVITREGGSAFDVIENTGGQAGKPASWGRNSLAPFFDVPGGSFVLDFSMGITFFTVETGDYGGDSDDILLEAWTGAGGTGTLLGTAGGSYGASSFTTVLTPGGFIPGTAMSIIMRGGSAGFKESMFYDNITVESVPEPATFAVLGIGALALLRRKRK